MFLLLKDSFIKNETKQNQKKTHKKYTFSKLKMTPPTPNPPPNRTNLWTRFWRWTAPETASPPPSGRSSCCTARSGSALQQNSEAAPRTGLFSVPVKNKLFTSGVIWCFCGSPAAPPCGEERNSSALVELRSEADRRRKSMLWHLSQLRNTRLKWHFSGFILFILFFKQEPKKQQQCKIFHKQSGQKYEECSKFYVGTF